jgi:signal transduction histidine kinase
MFVVAAALLGLLAVLAALQYRWLGRISDAERERRSAALTAHASAFAQDFDRELTRAYLTFQLDPAQPDATLAARIAPRYAQWQSTSRYPRLVQDVFVARGHPPAVQRFDPASGALTPVEWPAALHPVRDAMAAAPVALQGRTAVFHAGPASVWDEAPALVVRTALLFIADQGRGEVPAPLPEPVYAIVLLDREYIIREMLPALSRQHFADTPDGAEYQLAVVRADSHGVLYRSSEQFSPSGQARMDAASDMFGVRVQEFGPMVSEIRRFSSFVTAGPGRVDWTSTAPTITRRRELEPGPAGEPRNQLLVEAPQMSIVVQQATPGGERAAIERSAIVASAVAGRATGAGRWRLVVQHRAGSLEAAVDATRRRNLAISSGVLAMLGVSVGFLVVSTRRAQQLARQQMEFVAAVSHELRTPLAVIRSAADNLADGVVQDGEQIRRYGALVRNEGRRLTEMVEQILELAGITSGQRALVLRPVAIRPLLEDVVAASETLVRDAGMTVEYTLPEVVPPVLADEAALRRVFQNLIGNAIKYGANGGWIGLRVDTRARDVIVTVADRGIGIPPAEQGRIFEPFYRTPDVVAAQIQGAGLGLSLVRRILEAHGGRVTVRSTPGAGSEFSVTLPAAAEEPLPRTADAADPASLDHAHRA